MSIIVHNIVFVTTPFENIACLNYTNILFMPILHSILQPVVTEVYTQISYYPIHRPLLHTRWITDAEKTNFSLAQGKLVNRDKEI